MYMIQSRMYRVNAVRFEKLYTATEANSKALVTKLFQLYIQDKTFDCAYYFGWAASWSPIISAELLLHIYSLTEGFEDRWWYLKKVWETRSEDTYIKALDLSDKNTIKGIYLRFEGFNISITAQRYLRDHTH